MLQIVYRNPIPPIKATLEELRESSNIFSFISFQHKPEDISLDLAIKILSGQI